MAQRKSSSGNQAENSFDKDTLFRFSSNIYKNFDSITDEFKPGGNALLVRADVEKSSSSKTHSVRANSKKSHHTNLNGKKKKDTKYSKSGETSLSTPVKKEKIAPKKVNVDGGAQFFHNPESNKPAVKQNDIVPSNDSANLEILNNNIRKPNDSSPWYQPQNAQISPRLAATFPKQIVDADKREQSSLKSEIDKMSKDLQSKVTWDNNLCTSTSETKMPLKPKIKKVTNTQWDAQSQSFSCKQDSDFGNFIANNLSNEAKNPSSISKEKVPKTCNPPYRYTRNRRGRRPNVSSRFGENNPPVIRHEVSVVHYNAPPPKQNYTYGRGCRNNFPRNFRGRRNNFDRRNSRKPNEGNRNGDVNYQNKYKMAEDEVEETINSVKATYDSSKDSQFEANNREPTVLKKQATQSPLPNPFNNENYIRRNTVSANENDKNINSTVVKERIARSPLPRPFNNKNNPNGKDSPSVDIKGRIVESTIDTKRTTNDKAATPILRSRLIEYGGDISDLIVGCDVAMNTFLSFYTKWKDIRKNTLVLFETLEKKLSSSTNKSKKVQEYLALFGTGLQAATLIPIPKVSGPAKVLSVLSSVMSRLFNNPKSKVVDSSAADDFELTKCLVEDMEATTDIYMYGMQCNLQYEETCEKIEELRDLLQNKDLKDIADVVEEHFLRDICNYNPRNKVVFYLRLQTIYKNLIRFQLSDISKSFCRAFQDFPNAPSVIHSLHWRFKGHESDKSEVLQAWEEITDLLQREDSATINEVIKKIQKFILTLLKERSLIERYALDFKNT